MNIKSSFHNENTINNSKQIINSSLVAINKDAIKHNWQQLTSQCIEGSAVIKANSYGLYTKNIAPILLDAGCKNFFVASLQEAISLHNIITSYKQTLTSKISIYILNGIIQEYETPYFIKYRFIPVLNSVAQIKTWLNIQKENPELQCCIHFDTGMNRLGIVNDEVQFLEQNPHILKQLNINLVMSHFANSENENCKTVGLQNNLFLEIISKLKLNHIRKSISASNGYILNSKYNHDLVRFGTAIYGHYYYPLNHKLKQNNLDLKIAVNILGKVLAVQQASAGRPIGYKTNEVLKQNRFIAKLGIGYIDGLMRQLYDTPLNKYHAVYQDIRFPIIGKISMDNINLLVPQEISKPKDLVGKWFIMSGERNPIHQYISNERELYCTIGKRCIRICYTPDEIISNKHPFSHILKSL